MAGDTIAAISTAPGEGAIAIVRLSGPQAVAVADRIFQGETAPSKSPARLQHLGQIMDGENPVDQVLISTHRAPASYTGEDVVEISCHGGTLPAARILELCLRSGARPARAGEFTERAFLNGKMDLTQAEAVIDLIRARTDLALRSALEQLEGSLGQRVTLIRDELVDLTANVEASLDFADEDISPAEEGAVLARLESVMDKISSLLATADRGRVMREGVRTVIYGPTNAGKSSLLNCLLGYDRAIVSASPGTTRDTVEESIQLNGILLRLRDTAGIRESIDEVEREGIERTRHSLGQADLALHVVDASGPRPDGFPLAQPELTTLLVLNKSDLPPHPDWQTTAGARISCKTGEGIAALEKEIVERIGGAKLEAESAVAINARHRDCLRRALESCRAAVESIGKGATPDLYAMDVRSALNAVGELIGTVDYERLLDSGFGKFCIGK